MFSAEVDLRALRPILILTLETPLVSGGILANFILDRPLVVILIHGNDTFFFVVLLWKVFLNIEHFLR
jgi:hypothetical protein